MNKLLKNKKICIALLVICVLVLTGVIIGISMKGDKDDAETGKTDSGQEIIVHESDEDTVEEKAEGGLTESDSEDGPVLNEDNMIDFNGSDAKDDNKADNGGKTDSEGSGNENAGNESGDSENAGNENAGNESGDNNSNDNEDENPKKDDEEDSENTGSWGAFY